jgi:hypothetical protein
VDYSPIASERLGLLAFIVLSGLGVLAGFGSLTGYAGSRWMTVATARNAAESPRSRLPRLPRGIVLGLFFSALPLLKGWCSPFLNAHPYFILVYICCGISTATWLFIASFLQSPSGEGISPLWLRAWNWANVTGFLLLIAFVLNRFATLSG